MNVFDDDRFTSAIALRDRGDNEAAIREFQAMAESPCTPEEYAILKLNEAVCCLRLKDAKQARALFDCARPLLNESTRDIIMYADFQDACITASEGNLATAITEYQNLQQKYSDLLASEVHAELAQDIDERLAFELANANRLPEATERLLMLLKKGIGDIQRIEFFLGLCYQKQQDKRAALAEFAATLSGPDACLTARAHYNVARIVSELGKAEEARQHFDQALVYATPECFSEEELAYIKESAIK